jgi:NADH:ubiquinone oxidoreductase subunit 3 (subunit A)
MTAIALLATDSDTNSGGTNTRVVTFTPAVDDLLVLVVGFIYEWKKGALEWD